MERSEPSSVRFNLLDLTVEPFAHCVGEAVREVVQQAREMSLEHRCLGDHRSQLALGCPLVPLLEETHCSNTAKTLPERSELLLHGPRSTCLECLLLEFTKTQQSVE